MAAQGSTSQLVVPLNFELVSVGVYRSGFPTRRNIEFLRRLGLRCILRLSGKAYSPEVLDFIASSRIAVIDCSTEGNRVSARGLAGGRAF